MFDEGLGVGREMLAKRREHGREDAAQAREGRSVHAWISWRSGTGPARRGWRDAFIG
ncbi:hypothetical protein [Burkholderia gladioli]|uniref:hypothetical protein n=1 Tax=Burkholderia gladioli TaxID=28095 RepID=UPI001FC8909B|nr:hypothetical protein [Burkholderia gladioli]